MRGALRACHAEHKNGGVNIRVCSFAKRGKRRMFVRLMGVKGTQSFIGCWVQWRGSGVALERALLLAGASALHHQVSAGAFRQLYLVSSPTAGHHFPPDVHLSEAIFRSFNERMAPRNRDADSWHRIQTLWFLPLILWRDPTWNHVKFYTIDT